MVGALIRMKLAVLRHSMTGERAGWMTAGGVIGLILALGTIALGLDGRPMSVDVLGLALAMWMIGWIAGPVLFGGQSILKAEHFALLPVARYRLAIGLLGAAFVGVTAAVTFVAFTSLLAYGLQLGVGPALVAVPAVVLQVVLVVVLSRVATEVFGTVMQSRAGAAGSAVLIAGMLVATQSGWMIYVGLEVSGLLDSGFPPAFSAVVRALPSSWGLVAVAAAQRADWPLVVFAMAALAAGILLLLAVWGRLLAAPRSARVIIRGPRRGAVQRAHRLLPVGATAAVVGRELRTWWRAPPRTTGYVLPPAWALMTCLLPLTFGSTALLPWAAPGIAVMAATTTVNLYGEDGTALWMALTIPGAERRDVRGRQWAWLVVFGPMTVATAVVLTGLSGLDWAWPWVLALVPALLGGGMGLSVWASVVALVPMPDPRGRRDSPMDRGDAGGMGIAVFWLALLPAVPALAVMGAGVVRDDAALLWSGVPVGVVTGVICAWWLGDVAAHRLQARGPEMLTLLRSGRPSGAPATRPEPTAVDTMPRWERIYVTILAPSLGSIAIFPQGLVPVAIKLTGGDERLWFLALYVPRPWQWPVIAGMIVLGLVLYGTALRMYLTRRRALSASPELSGAVP